MKILKRLMMFIATLFVSILGIIIIVAKTIFPIYDSLKSGTVLFACIYQLGIIWFTAIPVFLSLDAVYVNGKINIILVSLLCLLAFAIVLCLNCAIELWYCLHTTKVKYKDIIEIQKYFHNYALIIVSILALYFAAFQPKDNATNIELLALGILFFVATVCSDAYRVFIYKEGQGPVNKLAEKIKSMEI